MTFRQPAVHFHCMPSEKERSERFTGDWTGAPTASPGLNQSCKGLEPDQSQVHTLQTLLHLGPKAYKHFEYLSTYLWLAVHR